MGNLKDSNKKNYNDSAIDPKDLLMNELIEND